MQSVRRTTNRTAKVVSRTKTLATFFYYPRLLTQRDELARPALHCLFVSTACVGEVGRESNDFFYMPIVVVPELDLEG